VIPPAPPRGLPRPDPFSLWGKNWLVWRLGRRHLATVTHLARGRALDIGCGNMPMLPVFAGRVGPVVGLDRPRPDGLEIRAHVHGAAAALPFREAAFETAFCLQVLEHVSEPEQCLREALRVLAPGGHLILTAPHIWNVHEAPHDYYRFTEYGLRYLLEKAGFEVVEVRAMGGYFVTAGARLCYFIAHFDRWGLQVLTRPLFLVVQALSAFLDRIYCDRTETWNYLGVGRRPGA
jgi:SAM-dependent methyltransferase